MADQSDLAQALYQMLSGGSSVPPVRPNHQPAQAPAVSTGQFSQDPGGFLQVFDMLKRQIPTMPYDQWAGQADALRNRMSAPALPIQVAPSEYKGQ